MRAGGRAGTRGFPALDRRQYGIAPARKTPLLHTVGSEIPGDAMKFVFPPAPTPALPVAGSESFFPVRRIFCVGRNYAEHAREMGAAEQADGREPPFFFMKPADALVGGEGEITVVYPPQTANLHHEIELVVALAGGGSDIPVERALACVFGYAAGLDLTRRDLQARAKEKGHPWDMGKGFDQSAVAGAVQPVARCGHPRGGRIWLEVNGELRQEGDLAQMSWQVAEVIAKLSQSVRLASGDLIYTGTPAGVGALLPGDRLAGGVAGVGRIEVRVAAPERRPAD